MISNIGAWKCEASIYCVGPRGFAPTKMEEALSMRLDRLPTCLSHLGPTCAHDEASN